MTRWLRVIALGALIIALRAHAIDPMPFDDAAQEQRFRALVAELRCLVCQNQNLADSDAELARDLRAEVFEMIQNGKTDDEIKAFLVERYGDFVLYKPPVRPGTWLLWFGPILVLIVGAVVVLRVVRRRAGALPPDARGEEDMP
jgi:cytochrome c-type biogenesis protein CcmH